MSSFAADLVASASAVLLDFDGPVTALMPPPVNQRAADSARAALPAGAQAMPPEVATSTDHLAVLRWAATQGFEALDAVERACIEAEVDAAARSTPTLGALEFLRACAAQEKPVAIVSNNSAEAVRVHLNKFQANGLVRGVVGRAPHHPELMKPHPSLVLAALEITQTTPARTVLIGDSVSDIEVSHLAGLRAIGFAKTPTRGRELDDAGADAITDTLQELFSHAGRRHAAGAAGSEASAPTD